MGGKKILHDNIIMPTLTCASETQTLNGAQRSRIQAVKIDHLGACGLNRMDGESNESVYGNLVFSFLKVKE